MVAILLSMLGILPGLVAAVAAAAGAGGFSNFRQKCATPWLEGGTTLRAPCREACSWCRSFYLSAVDLNACVGVDAHGNLVGWENGNFSDSCTHCFTTWTDPDILRCRCSDSHHNLQDTTLNLNSVVGNHCGRLACWRHISVLGPPLSKPDPMQCGVNSDDASGVKLEVQTAPPPRPSGTLG